MKPNIDFNECLKDSPRFRQSLEDSENDLDVLENKLDKLVKLCMGMIEAGKSFNNANRLFVGGIQEVATQFNDDDLVSTALRRFITVLVELQKYNSILLDQAHRSICKNLNNFVKHDIKKVKESRKHFEKISDDMDTALLKNSQAQKSKTHEIEEAESMLKATRTCFNYTSLDYVFQVNVLHSKKRYEILDTVLSYTHAQNTFFHQGYDLFEDLDPFIKQVASQIEELSTKAAVEKKEMEDRHSLVQLKEVNQSKKNQKNLDYSNADEGRKDGYLFKRTSNAFKTWVRRWFMIKDNQLVYRKRSRDTLSVMEKDLRFCSVKPFHEIDRRFCFEVVSPTRVHILQGDSETECQNWIDAIQAAISKAFNKSHSDDYTSRGETLVPDDTSPTEDDPESQTLPVGSTALPKPSKPKKQFQPKGVSRMKQLLSIPGNNKCSDCGSAEPRWASINLGITFCIECSGIHRSLGVHMSKVRSVTLDAWEPELLKVMAELGNDIVNRIYEANIDKPTVIQATPQCPRDVREQWIKAKYVDRAFIAKLPTLEQEGETASPLRHWSVCKKKRRSPSEATPSKSRTDDESPGDDSPESPGDDSPESPGDESPGDDKSPGSEESANKQGTPESEQVKGRTDVMVFGATINTQGDADRDFILEDTDSGSDPEADQDSQSTTSYEDFSKLHPDMLLFKASQARNIPVMLEAISQNANPNWQNTDEEGKTPLIKAVESGSMAAVEFLLLNRAKVDVQDLKGRSPLHHATQMGHTGQVCQFLKRHANQHGVDELGLNALSIAVTNANADIVTLLRLAKMNEEMREAEGYYGPDETFNDVFRDFTQMANNTPEKLNRNK